MKIVIPMSGRGQRFINAGYTVPKPMIIVDGKPIIAHVVDMFSQEDTFIFICAKDHLSVTNMRQTLMGLAPNVEIVEIEPHKFGPIYAVKQAFHLIEDTEEVIINYCDFGSYWDYSDFLKHTRLRNADGAIPAYRGFHPHMLGTTNYAFMRENEQWMLEIQEKKPFTNNRMNEYASSGTYYFKTGAILKTYLDLTMDKHLDVNGEFYVSVVYNLLVEEGLSVSIYEIQHMLQWGTPEDLADYNYHSNYFKKLMSHKNILAPVPGTINLIPLAGEGSRFKNEGYEMPKPLIEVSGKKMIVQAFDAYPVPDKAHFIVLDSHCRTFGIDTILRDAYPGCNVIKLDYVTEGQAITASLGVAEEDLDKPLLIAACDNGLLIDGEAYTKCLTESDVDVVCLTFRNNPTVGANPKGYGYVKIGLDNTILGVSVKEPISEKPMNDHAIVGAFYFKKARAFMAGVAYLKENECRINGEFYIDSIIGILDALHLKGCVFECDYESWGTPNDYKTYVYWQSFFHKAAFHPYSIKMDPMFPEDQRAIWIERAKSFKQEHR